MKEALFDIARKAGRPIKRAIQTAIDGRLADYHMPANMPGDVLLTFDDGPHPDHTPVLLDMLDAYSARAVFFMIGLRAEKRPDLVKACHDRGHVVANHTYTHLNDGIGGRYTRQRVIEDIARCTEVLRQGTAERTRQFRPPRGELNPKTWGAARATGHRILLWSVEGGEWGRRQDQPATEISRHVVSTLKRRDILLLHDDNEKTLRVMADLLPRLKSEAFDMGSAVSSLRQANGS
jgi:peptidoglycan/xylan/chitin deacetylase (PgdA/CDA1 family)